MPGANERDELSVATQAAVTACASDLVRDLGGEGAKALADDKIAWAISTGDNYQKTVWRAVAASVQACVQSPRDATHEQDPHLPSG